MSKMYYKSIFLFLAITYSLDTFSQSSNTLIVDNQYLYNYFKEYYSEDIAENEAIEIDIEDAFSQLYEFDKFELEFKILFYTKLFKSDSLWKSMDLEDEHLIALTVYLLKSDVFNEDNKFYKNNFKSIYKNPYKLIADAMHSACKIKFVSTREEMVELQKKDFKNDYNYIPQECYYDVISAVKFGFINQIKND